MSLVTLTASMLSAHGEHKVARAACPLCKKWGAAPAPEAAYVGRPVAVNPPHSANPKDW